MEIVIAVVFLFICMLGYYSSQPYEYKKPVCKKHDWDMGFPDKENPLAWCFVCNNCGKTRPDMPSVFELIK